MEDGIKSPAEAFYAMGILSTYLKTEPLRKVVSQQNIDLKYVDQVIRAIDQLAGKTILAELPKKDD